jgi:heterodisulfide reductase subunit A
MYATKEAIVAKEHHPDMDIHVFMMEMRAFSKGYWDYYNRARENFGVQYHRTRISGLREEPRTRNLVLQLTSSEEGFRTTEQENHIKDSPLLMEEEFDLVVLSVGMEISSSVRELGSRMGVELDEYGFCRTVQFNPIETSRPGIYAIGPFREPKDIPESVVEASGAVAASASLLSDVRWSRTREAEYPPEREVLGAPPRIGVFVCHCGSNIGGFLDVPGVAEYADHLTNVVYNEHLLYACSQDSIELITQKVKENNLNRVVVASCSPLTHAALFQDSIRMAGLNPYLFEMANIRNQCSWVHSNDWNIATTKAKELVRMAVARAGFLEPQHTINLPVKKTVLVVGGGAAGMAAAISLGQQGFLVHLVEKDLDLGGNLRKIFTFSHDDHEEWNPQRVLDRLIEQVSTSENIKIHTESQVVSSSGFLGNYTSAIAHRDGDRTEIEHGATILATGAQEYRGPEYQYGNNPHIVTQQEFEVLLGGFKSTRDPGAAKENAERESTQLPRSVVMIQCIGPAESYCSRICCTVALKNAITLKAMNPEAQIVILYKDIRAYGFKERLYSQAREEGIIFVRYDDEHKPKVDIRESPNKDMSSNTDDLSLHIRGWDLVMDREIVFEPDLLVLSMPVVPNPDAKKMVNLFKVSLDQDGFFQEAHVKLRPVDFSTDGVFMAGMAHYPKLLDETIIQAQAAAARVARVLSRGTIEAGGRVAVVDETLCTGCLTCVRICPFNVPIIKSELTGVGNIQGAAYIEPSICQGCGVCAADCPAQAIQLNHFTDSQLIAKVRSLVNPETSFIPVEELLISN